MNRRKRMLRNVCIYTSIFILAIAGFIYFLVQKSAQNDEALAEPAPENQITKTALIVVGEVLRTSYERSKLYDPDFTTEFRQGTDTTQEVSP